MSKHALIIGGTGFISTYAVEAFAAAGYRVTTITRGNKPDVHGDLVSTRQHVNCNDRVKFPKLQSESLQLVQESQGEAPELWDVVVDFICFVPGHAEDVVKGLTGLTRCFVFISTDSVYEVCKPVLYRGGRKEEDCVLASRNDATLRKIDEYGYEKQLCERIFEKSTLPYVAFRLPDVMGEREYPRCRHMQLQSRVMLGLPVYINPDKNKVVVEKPGSHGAGQKLSFVYAGDVARASVEVSRLEMKARDGTCSESVVAWDKLKMRAINLGSHEQCTLQEYVTIIADAIQVKPYFFSSGPNRIQCIQDKMLDSISYTRLVHRHTQGNGLDWDSSMKTKDCAFIDQRLEEQLLPPWSPTERPSGFVSRVLGEDYEVSESSDSSSSDDSDRDIFTQPTVTEEQLLRQEESEDDDMYGYLPSVEQGAINMALSEELIPGWKPTPLEQWCRRMSLWYLHKDTRSILDVDPISIVKRKVRKIQVK